MLEEINVGDRDHVKALIGYLLPETGESWIDQLVHSGAAEHAQDAKADDVYWNRLWSEQVVDNREPRDQTVLIAISEAKQSGSWSNFAQHLEADNGWVDVYERLHKKYQDRLPDCLMTVEEHFLAASASNELLIEQQAADASRDFSQSFVPIWRTIGNAYRVERDNLFKWVMEQVRSTLPKSVCLATDIIDYWAEGSQTQLTFQQSACVMEETSIIARELWQDAPDQLSAALSAASISHAHSLGRLFSLRREEQRITDVGSRWLWMGPVLQQAIRISPFEVAFGITGFSVGSQRSLAPDEVTVHANRGTGWPAEWRVMASTR